MNTKTVTADKLLNYFRTAAIEKSLQTTLSQLELRLTKIEEQIEQFERLGLKETVEVLAIGYNDLNLKRIKTELKIKQYEIEMLNFELVAATRD